MLQVTPLTLFGSIFSRSEKGVEKSGKYFKHGYQKLRRDTIFQKGSTPLTQPLFRGIGVLYVDSFVLI